MVRENTCPPRKSLVGACKKTPSERTRGSDEDWWFLGFHDIQNHTTRWTGRHFASSSGTEELGHLEMIGTIVHQLTRTLTDAQIKSSGFDSYFVDHTAGVYPTAASGFPWSAASMAVKGDLIADLTEDLAAEQKARVTYDNILRLSDDPDVNDAIKFLRAREVVHFQRFGEGLQLAKERLNEKNIYFMNPSFDR